jgi:hypothetical protein
MGRVRHWRLGTDRRLIESIPARHYIKSIERARDTICEGRIKWTMPMLFQAETYPLQNFKRLVFVK